MPANNYTRPTSRRVVGITGTKAQFDDAVTDGDILYVGDVTAFTNEAAQDAVGAMVDASLTYVDATPLLQRAALTGAITATAGSNATLLGSFTTAQINTALSDGDIATGGGTATGTNTGDQTSIVGITGTLTQFNTALTGADFASGGGTATGTNTGDQTSIVGITGTVAQFNTAITDGDLATGGGTATGTNTGDNAVNTLYSGLVSNATHTGDATGATALTVVKINGTTMSALATGILKNTTGTGVPSIAVNSDLPAMSATVGGAVPTPPNNTTTFLRGDGTFAVPPGGSGSFTVTETEIDFGTTPVSEASFVITDALVTSSAMKILTSVSYAAPTGKDQDELEMDDLQLRAVAGTGNFTLYVKSADGSYLADKFKINYSFA